ASLHGRALLPMQHHGVADERIRVRWHACKLPRTTSNVQRLTSGCWWMLVPSRCHRGSKPIWCVMADVLQCSSPRSLTDRPAPDDGHRGASTRRMATFPEELGTPACSGIRSSRADRARLSFRRKQHKLATTVGYGPPPRTRG